LLGTGLSEELFDNFVTNPEQTGCKCGKVRGLAVWFLKLSTRLRSCEDISFPPLFFLAGSLEMRWNFF
jgi:hypothetical protein